MRYTQLRWLAMVAVAIVSLVGASSALALSVNPLSPSVADIQGLGNSTDANNLSTIDAIVVGPDGIHLDVTWRIGQDQSAFDPFFGQTFARIGVVRYTNGEDGGLGRNLTSYDGIKWCIMSDLDLQNAQPFLQTAPNWWFYEPSIGIPIAGGMVMNMALLDFTQDTQNFGGQPQGTVGLDGNGEIRGNAMGLQIVGPAGLALGDAVQGHIWISNWVPEPTSAMLLVLGAVGLVGGARRRQS